MAIEIERKFLIIPEKLPPLDNGTTIEQAYVPTANGTTVRVRISGEQACIGIKSRAVGFTRREFEYPIPMADARELLQEVCGVGRIEKKRYLIRQGTLTWEIDVFGGLNAGLIVAEVELDSERQEVNLPEWVKSEVTDDPRYSNHALSLAPFSAWQSSGSPPASSSGTSH